jgi:cobalt-zinc-cadmium efflux system protein
MAGHAHIDGDSHGPAAQAQHDHSPHNSQHAHGNSQHHHSHGHSHRHASQRVLVTVLALNAVYLLAEVVGGLLANSLALLSDAGHMLTDVAAITLSLFAARFAAKPATPRKTYGFYRLEILAALANGVTLVVIAVFICYEAYERLRAPQGVHVWTMLAVSAGGLAVNLVSARLLFGAHHHDLNVRGAFLHVLGDLFGSVGAVAAGLLIAWRGWVWADPAISVLISLLVVYSSWRLISDSVNVLLEGTPAHINLAAVEAAMKTVAGVRVVHDLHVWTITSNRHALTAHVVVDDLAESHRVLRELRELLAERFGLTHSTLQLEDPVLSSLVKIRKDEKRRAS